MKTDYPQGTASVWFNEHARRGQGQWQLSFAGSTVDRGRKKSAVVSRARDWANNQVGRLELVIERKDGTVQDRVVYEDETENFAPNDIL